MVNSDRQRNLDEVTLPNLFAYSRFVAPAAGGASGARGPAPRRGRWTNTASYGNPILTRHIRESCSDSQHASQIDLGLLHVHVSTCMTCSSTGTCMRVSVTSVRLRHETKASRPARSSEPTRRDQLRSSCRASQMRAVRTVSTYSDIATRRLLYSVVS